MAKGKKVIHDSMAALLRSQSSVGEEPENIATNSIRTEGRMSRDAGINEETNPVDDLILEANPHSWPVRSQCTALLQLQFHESDETSEHFLEFYGDKNKRCLARSFTAGYDQAVEDVSLVFEKLEAPIALSEIIGWLEWFKERNTNDWEQMTLSLPFLPDKDMNNWAKGWNLGYGSAICLLRNNSGFLTSNVT